MVKTETLTWGFCKDWQIGWSGMTNPWWWWMTPNKLVIGHRPIAPWTETQLQDIVRAWRRHETQQNKRASGKRRRGTKPGSASFLYIKRKGRMKRPIGMSQEGGFLPGTLPNREVTKEKNKTFGGKKRNYAN